MQASHATGLGHVLGPVDGRCGQRARGPVNAPLTSDPVDPATPLTNDQFGRCGVHRCAPCVLTYYYTRWKTLHTFRNLYQRLHGNILVHMIFLLSCAAIAALVSTTPQHSRPARELHESELDSSCRECSEQVHLALGGANEMVISWATKDDLSPPVVTFWGADMRATMTRGTTNAYTQLAYVTHELTAPRMGAAGATKQALLRRANTSLWARLAFFPFGRASNYREPSKVRYRLAHYNNYDMIYNSPVIHTVRLVALKAGATYVSTEAQTPAGFHGAPHSLLTCPSSGSSRGQGYSVAGAARNFSFTMPPASEASNPEAFPFSVGLTADLGQTVVSRANVEILRRRAETMAVGVVLLAGDLSCISRLELEPCTA